MDLVDNYLASLRRNLPADKADDIVAELADELQSRREDREARLGRPLDREETSAMLRDLGHPLVVAARYRPHQFLIGPRTFPFYAYAMKVVLATGVALVAGLAMLSVVLNQSNIIRGILHAVDDLSSFFIFAVSLVTLVFAVVERRGFPAEHLVKWMPEQLPNPLARSHSQWQSAFEVGLNLAFLLWWAGAVTIPMAMHGGGLIAPGPVWDAYWLPILLLACVQLVVNLVKWLRPRWSTATSLLTILVSAISLAIIAGIHRAGSWVVVANRGRQVPDALQIAGSVNLAIRIALVVVAVMMLLQLLGELWKLVRPRLQSAG